MTDRDLPQYEHNGPSLTIPEWATVTGIRSYDISMRLRQGWTLARIIAEVKPTNAPAELTTPEPVAVVRTKPQPWTTMLFTHDGQTMNLKGWAERSGIKLSLLIHRLRSGWGLERAMAYPSGGAPRIIDHGTPVRTITFQGETLTLAQWAKRTGVSVPALRWRLERWTLDKALTRPTREDLAIRRRFNGETATLKEAAAQAGIAYSTFITRLRSGWSLAEALSIPPRSIMGNNAHRAAHTRRDTAAPQPEGAMSTVTGGGVATSHLQREPAIGPQLEIAPKQAFS